MQQIQQMAKKLCERVREFECFSERKLNIQAGATFYAIHIDTNRVLKIMCDAYTRGEFRVTYDDTTGIVDGHVHVIIDVHKILVLAKLPIQPQLLSNCYNALVGISWNETWRDRLTRCIANPDCFTYALFHALCTFFDKEAYQWQKQTLMNRNYSERHLNRFRRTANRISNAINAVRKSVLDQRTLVINRVLKRLPVDVVKTIKTRANCEFICT